MKNRKLKILGWFMLLICIISLFIVMYSPNCIGGELFIGGLVTFGCLGEISLLLKKPCDHLFRAQDMVSRNAEGIVKWPCFRCGKIFEAGCGLDILKHGSCDGKWGEAALKSINNEK